MEEEFLTAVRGSQLTSHTAIAKDVGIYHQTLAPDYGIKTTFKKSSCPPNCLAASDTHIFAAQQDKAHVHVYSRIRGNQEVFVPVSDRIRSLLLVDDVLALGTTDGKVLLWEICTGRLISAPPVHVQSVSCMAATRTHLLTGSDDSNVNIWSLARLMQLDASSEPDPERTLVNHTSALTALVASKSTNPHSSLCASASKDKTCIIWNHQSGEALRTILFSSTPCCLALDSFPRTLAVSSDDSSLHVIDLFGGGQPLLGRYSTESSSTPIRAPPPVAVVDDDMGSASCIAFSYDGNTLLSGHPKGQVVKWFLNGDWTELVNLNFPVTNIVFIPPAHLTPARSTRPLHVVKPGAAGGACGHTVKFEQHINHRSDSRFDSLLNTFGFSGQVLRDAVRSLD